MGELVPLKRSARLAARDPSAEKALRERFARGDVDVLPTLLGTDLDLLYTYCLRITRGAADADDLVQDTLVRAMRKHHLYDPSFPLRPWIFRMATNLWRSRQRSPLHRIFRALGDLVQVDTTNAEQLTADLQRDQALRAALQSLPEIYREAVALCHLESLSYAEMEQITGVTEAALKQRVRRGRILLGEAMQRLYPELSPARTDGEASE